MGRLTTISLILGFAFFLSPAARAQTVGVTLSGHVTGPAQSVIEQATVSLKNSSTGESRQVETDPSGSFTLLNVAPDSYELSVSAPGYQTKTDSLIVRPGAAQTVDVMLDPQSPGLSLGDLGIPEAAARGNPEAQVMLDRRTHMLQVHQRLGLVTAAPMLASILTSFSAKSGRFGASSPTGRDLHAVLGTATAGLYVATAYFAIRAPSVPGMESRGHIRLHKALAWIHGPGMVLTPTLGAMAFSQESKGQRVHGIASLHSPVAVATFGAFVGAMLSISIR